MQQTITVRGLVTTHPHTTERGELMFRLAQLLDHPEHYANWFTVIARGHLAEHALECIDKGDRLIVVGTLRARDWDNGEYSGTTMEIYAETMGRDLGFIASPVNASEVL